MIPMYYGGIDRIYGDISIEGADKILDLVDEFTDLVEALSTKCDKNEIEQKDG